MTSPVPWGLSWVSVAFVLTLPAMRGSIVLGNPPRLLYYPFSPTQGRKSPVQRGGKTPSCPVPSGTQLSGAPTLIPRTALQLGRQPAAHCSCVCAHISAECPAMPTASGNRIPTSTAVRCRATTEIPELSALIHLGTPALTPECAERTPPGGHRRYEHNTKKTQF